MQVHDKIFSLPVSLVSVLLLIRSLLDNAIICGVQKAWMHRKLLVLTKSATKIRISRERADLQLWKYACSIRRESKVNNFKYPNFLEYWKVIVCIDFPQKSEKKHVFVGFLIVEIDFIEWYLLPHHQQRIYRRFCLLNFFARISRFGCRAGYTFQTS